MKDLKFAFGLVLFTIQAIAASLSLTVKLLLWYFTDKSIFIRSSLKTMEGVQRRCMKLGAITVDDELYQAFEKCKSAMRMYAY